MGSYCGFETRTGVGLLLVLPSPSWPDPLPPQQ